MYTIKTLTEFDDWLDALKDNMTRIRLARRLEKACRGNLGDVKPLGGGDKSSQQKDIETAKSRVQLLED